MPGLLKRSATKNTHTQKQEKGAANFEEKVYNLYQVSFGVLERSLAERWMSLMLIIGPFERSLEVLGFCGSQRPSDS